MVYFVLGIEPFKIAEVFGQHENKDIARIHAAKLNGTKSVLCVQRYAVLTKTQIRKKRLILIA